MKFYWTIILVGSLISNAQNTAVNFKSSLDSLKLQENLSEFIYLQLDAYVKNPSVEDLSIFDDISTSIWRRSNSTKEFTAQLYLYINKAYYFKQFGFINQSINQYERAYSIYKGNNEINFDIIEFCLKPLANNYTRIGEVDRAEDIIKIMIQKAITEKRTKLLINGYSNLSIVFRTKGNYTKAIDYLKLALNLEDLPQGKSRIHSDIAINYLFLNNVSKAFENIKKSNSLNVQNSTSILMRNEISMANCFLQQKEFDKGLLELEKALENSKIVFDDRDREVAKIYNQIANLFKEKNQIEKALEFHQKGLITLLPKYNPKSVKENPLPSFFYPENTIKESLDNRAELFYMKGDFTSALESYMLAFKVEAQLRASYLSQNSKVIQQQESRYRSEKCIDICYDLFQQTNNSNWIERAFQFAEQSKSIVLLDAKKDGFLKSKIKDDRLFLIEKELNYQKTQLNNDLVIEELKGKNASVDLLSQLTQERDVILNKLQLTKQSIEVKYPNLKIQNDSLISVKLIKKKLLNENESLIEFFDGKFNVYVFLISNGEKIRITKIVKDVTFKNRLEKFFNFFSESRGVFLQNNIEEYKKLGLDLYKEIFKYELYDDLIIVPDGLFSFIPFDALITKKTLSTNFEELPYLIRKNKIGYAYSAAIQLQDNNQYIQKKEKLVGFFPIFKNKHRELSELKYTKEEAESINHVMGGEFYINSEATKARFEKLSQNFSIIHLSTHASAGDYFIPPLIEFYDETLYLPEIYGYDLSTDLLILSACETGTGTLRKGSGTMSLARGFSFAGVKNLIVSLWKVNDKSTKELMAGFYKNFKTSGNKSMALHNSKLAYLNNQSVLSNKKSPYYWASFIYIGDTSKIEDESVGLIWVLILCFIILGIYFSLKNGRFGLNKS